MAALFTKETFMTMLETLDKDGDGTVTKEEFYSEYCKLRPDIGPMDGAKFNEEWDKIDEDKSGTVEVEELAKYYGFDSSVDGTNEMTDEQILEALQMQAQLDELARAKELASANSDKSRRSAPATRLADKTIKVVKLEKAISETGTAEQDFLTCCDVGQLGKLTAGGIKPEEKESALMFLDDERPEGPVEVRIKDEKGEMPLHKLARHVKPDHIKDLPQLFQRLVHLMRIQSKRDGRPSIHPDVNHQDQNGKTPLYSAVESKNEKMIDLLFELGRDGPDSLLVNTNGWTCMHAAVFSDDMPTLKKVVEKLTPARVKVLLTKADKTGREPLHIAAFKCSPEMNEFLVTLGANDDKKDAKGNTPTQLAEELVKTHEKTGDVEKKNRARKSKELIQAKLLQRDGRLSKDE